MSAQSTSPTTVVAAPGRRLGQGARLRRVGALVRMELTLLVRNRTALFNAVALAPMMVLLMLGVIDEEVKSSGGGVFAGVLLVSLFGFGLLFIVYYNITATAVARREELTLKRLTTGEATGPQVLVGMAAPAALIILAQLVAGFVVVGLGLELPPMTNPVLVLAAVLLGTAVFVLLGYASSGVTRTVESAQITTLPVLAVAMAFSGLTLPLSVLPDALRTVAELTPLAPVTALMRLGMTGLTPDGDPVTFASSFAEAGLPVAVLVAWTVLGVWAVRRWMRWEPRR